MNKLTGIYAHVEALCEAADIAPGLVKSISIEPERIQFQLQPTEYQREHGVTEVTVEREWRI